MTDKCPNCSPVHRTKSSTDTKRNDAIRGLTGKRCAVIGAPCSTGQPLPGVGKAPAAMWGAGLQKMIESIGWDCDDIENLTFTKQPDFDAPINDFSVIGADSKTISDACHKAASEGKFVLSIGGDHSIATGTITGILRAKKKLAVIWIDAHGDANTPDTSPSGNYHGMPAAHVLGWFKDVQGFDWIKEVPDLPEVNLAYIGLRDLDPMEVELLEKSQVHVFTMTDVDRMGIGPVMRSAMSLVNPDSDRAFHLSFDVDSIDPSVAPGTGTKARGGLTYRESHYICDALAQSGLLGSMDLVEVNPDLDPPQEEPMHGDSPIICKNSGQTVRLGVELVGSALGKTILGSPVSSTKTG